MGTSSLHETEDSCDESFSDRSYEAYTGERDVAGDVDGGHPCSKADDPADLRLPGRGGGPSHSVAPGALSLECGSSSGGGA